MAFYIILSRINLHFSANVVNYVHLTQYVPWRKVASGIWYLPYYYSLPPINNTDSVLANMLSVLGTNSKYVRYQYNLHRVIGLMSL